MKNNKKILFICVTAFVLIFLVSIYGIYGNKNDLNSFVSLEPSNPWIEKPKTVHTYNGVPIDILERLIESESSWRVNAININKNEKSVGIAQVNMRWYEYYKEKYGLNDPYKPSEAIDFASRYLKDLYDRTGSWYEAVLSYKCGLDGRKNAPTNIKRISMWVAYGK